MPVVPTAEKDEICKSNVVLFVQSMLVHVTEKPFSNGCIPVPSGVTVQLALPVVGFGPEP